MYISIPLSIKKGQLEKDTSVKESIDSFLDLLLRTETESCDTDIDFGFIFNNLRFELFNEAEGEIYDSTPNAVHNGKDPTDVYNKKVSGTSKNINTFASELRTAIAQYEPRLTNIGASMSYMPDTRDIKVKIRGYITETEENYEYENIIKIWH